MGTIYFVGVIASVVAAAIVLSTAMRALTARIVTGKWPHQSKESEDIFRSLP